MDNTTVSAKTYDEAITKACIELQTTSEHLHVDVIEKGTNGLFGVLGGKPCVIRARVMTEEEITEMEEKAAAEKNKAEEDRKREEKAAEEKNKAEENRKREEKAAEEKRAEERRKEKTEGSASERSSVPDNSSEGIKAGQKKENGDKPKKEISEEDAEALQKKAEDFLTGLFRAMDASVSTESEFDHEENELSVLLNGDDMGILIGKRGQTLDSLQYLTSLVVNKHHEGYIRVKLDTENYRERREEKLQTLAKNIAGKVKRTRRPVSLEAMNPYERRIIHSALQDDPDCTTYSEGEDPYRHIVVVLKKDRK